MMFYSLLIIRALKSVYVLLATEFMAADQYFAVQKLTQGDRICVQSSVGFLNHIDLGYVLLCDLVFIFYLEHISSLLPVVVFLLLLPFSTIFLGEQWLTFGNISCF